MVAPFEIGKLKLTLFKHKYLGRLNFLEATAKIGVLVQRQGYSKPPLTYGSFNYMYGVVAPLRRSSKKRGRGREK